jgi:hypothetical protein
MSRISMAESFGIGWRFPSYSGGGLRRNTQPNRAWGLLRIPTQAATAPDRGDKFAVPDNTFTQ